MWHDSEWAWLCEELTGWGTTACYWHLANRDHGAYQEVYPNNRPDACRRAREVSCKTYESKAPWGWQQGELGRADSTCCWQICQSSLGNALQAAFIDCSFLLPILSFSTELRFGGHDLNKKFYRTNTSPTSSIWIDFHKDFESHKKGPGTRSWRTRLWWLRLIVRL